MYEIELCRKREHKAEKRRITRPKGPRGVSEKDRRWITPLRIEIITKVPPPQPRVKRLPKPQVKQGFMARIRRGLFGS